MIAVSSRRAILTDAGAKAMLASSYSWRSHPAPRPTCSRPSESTSSVASSLARTAGSRKSWASTVWVIRRVEVASATACPAMSGAKGRTKWSARPKVE